MRLLSIFLVFTVAQGLERRMSFTKNPNCDPYNMSLYYLRADGPNDTLHYLWDFAERPTVFMALTDLNTTLELDCIGFVDRLPNSFNFTSKPQYEFTLIFSKLIEFNDVNDTGVLTPQTPQISYDTKDFSWTTTEAKEDDDHRFVKVATMGTNLLAGNFSVELIAFGAENHDSELPRLLHSPNSTQCKITLENIMTNSGFNESRFAFEFIIVSSDAQDSSSKIVTRKNLDDENSPGIFSMVDIMTPKAQNQLSRGAFLQWRPIIYTSQPPTLKGSSETLAYNLTKVADPGETLMNTLPFMYYGYNLDSNLIERTVVSMGVSEDGFYKNTNYSSWTFLINYGSPEEEKFSLLVILVMCIGLGLPALLILTGGTYMCARRIRRSKDELSLER